MANLSNINNKFLVTTTGEVLIGQTANDGNRLQITGADGASYIYLKTDVATTGGRIGFNGDDLRVFNQQASGELNLGTAGTSRVRISNSLVVFPTITELRGDVAAKFAIGNMGGASSQMMVSSRGFLTLNVSNTGSALDATERMRIDSSGVISIGPSTTSSEIYFNYNNTNNKGGLKIDYSTGELRLTAGESGNGYHQAFYTNGAERMRISSVGHLRVRNSEGWTAANNTEVIGHSALEVGPIRNGTNNALCVVAVAGNLAAVQGIDSVSNNVQRLPLNPFGGGVGIGVALSDGDLEVNTSTVVTGASHTVNNVLIGLQGADRPTIILDTANTTYTNRTWNITNNGSLGSLLIGRNGLDVLVMSNSGNVGIGNTTETNRKLSVSGITKTFGFVNTNNYMEKLINLPNFPNGTANLNVDIQFGNVSFWGYIELEITGTYSNQSTPGKLTKLYAIGTNPGVIYENTARVSDAMGDIADNIALGDFRYDNTTGSETFAIKVSHIVSSGNGYTVKVKVFTHGSGASTVIDNLNYSSAYTETALARQYPYYHDRLGIGTTSPQTKLEVVGETLINSLGLKANRLNSGYNVAGDNADIWINYEGYLNNNLYYRNFNIGDGRNGTVATFNGSTKIAYFQGNVGIGTTSPFSGAKLDVNGNIYAKATAATIDVSAYNTTSGLANADLHLAVTSSGEGQVRMYGNYPLTFYTNNTERMRITSGGNIDINSHTGASIGYGVRIAKQSGYSQLYMEADTTSTRIIQRFYNPTGNVGNISIVAYNTTYSTSSSDERLKKNITNWDENILDKFKDIKPKEFNFNNQDNSEEKIKGYIAQNEVDKFPEAYPLLYNEEVGEDRHMFNPSGMVVYLMKAIQELKADNDSLKARIETLENN